MLGSAFLGLTLTISIYRNGSEISAPGEATEKRRWVTRLLYRRSEFGLNQSGSVAALSINQIIGVGAADSNLAGRWRNAVHKIETLDLAPDLGADIGSLRWWRGFATCGLLCTSAIAMVPALKPLAVGNDAPVAGDAWEETRAQSIVPLAWGADTGRRMAATDLVFPLGDAPERPSLSLSASLGQGDGFARVLERAGVGGSEAKSVAKLVADAVPLDEISPGTTIDLTLGRRLRQNMPRPVDALKFRARIDLSIMLRRIGNGLELTRIPIAVDRTPLRVAGLVGGSLYRSTRAAGVPAKTVETYIRAIGSKLSFDRDIDGGSRFDIIVEQVRAETGEVEHGKLLYAGLSRGSRQTQLLPWTIAGRTEWFEASGVGEKRGGMTAPVSGGRITSGFGTRFHPILGYSRFHQGVDYGAAYGTPIHAVTDGLVAFSGRNGGYGNHIRLNHGANLGSSYSHLSRIIVSPGSRVLQGQVIGYVGSTGLSTGPHLHFEVYRSGRVVNPRKVAFESSSLLSGSELQAFRNRLASLLKTPTAGAVR